MGDRISMSISGDGDGPSDETLDRRQYEFSFGIDVVQFSLFFQDKHPKKVIEKKMHRRTFM